MNLEVAQLVVGTETPVGEGVTGPTRCIIRTQAGVQRAAVIKRVPTQAIAAEAFCALVLRAWGLHVPHPYLISDGSGSVIGFGSADDGYPNLKQRIGLVSQLPNDAQAQLVVASARLVSTFTQTPLAIAADEAIDNQDRNLGNILWDGLNVAWIDHEGAMGIRPENGENKLAALMCLLESVELAKVAAVHSAHTIQGGPSLDPQGMKNEIFEGLGFADMLAKRLSTLAIDVLNRFPQPKDLLTPQ